MGTDGCVRGINGNLLQAERSSVRNRYRTMLYPEKIIEINCNMCGAVIDDSLELCEPCNAIELDQLEYEAEHGYDSDSSE